MVRLESENEKPQKKTRVEERTYKVIVGPDDDPPPKPEPTPKPKLKGLFEWIAGLFRRRRHKQATVGADLPATGRADKSAMGTINRPLHAIYAPIAAFSRTAK